MKLKETLLNTPNGDSHDRSEQFMEQGEQHLFTSMDTPLRTDAFLLSNNDKKKIIEEHFEKIMYTLGLDLNDDSLKGTPHRVAKMYVDEIFSGLDISNKPKISLFENKYSYNEMLVERNITFFSNCEHHFVPMMGSVHIGYISSGKVIGLSKLNRIVKYFSKRPQVQERLTNQIAIELQGVLETKNVAVVIEAEHLCVSSRGIEDVNSSTISSFYGGEFKKRSTREDFLRYLKL